MVDNNNVQTDGTSDAANNKNDTSYGYGGYDGYVETTVDPGPWLLLGTTAYCFSVMLFVVPIMVRYMLQKRKRENEESAADFPSQSYENMATASCTISKPETAPVDISAKSVLAFDKETRKILSLAIPFTVSALASSTFSNICLALVGRRVGTNAVSAYALVQILVGLTDGLLQGPIYACTTLCAHAVGAGNAFLAGQYVQLAILFYVLLNIPVMAFWWKYMEEIVLYLQWGDAQTAAMAEDFIQVYLFSYVLVGISNSLWQLLEVADHVIEGTLVSMAWGAVNVVVVSIIVTTREATLIEVGLAFNAVAFFFVAGTFLLAQNKGWLVPFNGGLFQSLALRNTSAITLMLRQALPLSWGSLLSNAEWAILTFFASYLGPAEVSAWAILGSIWGIFYSCTAGIGTAAEIRVSYHFGENHPSMARLSGYKTLLLSMLVASVVSIVFVLLQDRLPAWFTVDETLQAMLAELIPFVGVGNLTMQFGMTCWSLIGAQGKYKLATWVSFISSWGIAMPIAAIFVFVFRIDLQGLTSAVVIGYVTTGACLSYVLLSTDWQKVARRIQEQNDAAVSGKAAGEYNEHSTEELYASMQTQRYAARAAARGNIRLLSIPPGKRSGLIFGNIYQRPGTYIMVVKNWSPIYGRVRPGDSIVALEGANVTNERANEISSRLELLRDFQRDLAVISSLAAPTKNYADAEEDEDYVLFEAIAEDESFESPL